MNKIPKVLLTIIVLLAIAVVVLVIRVVYYKDALQQLAVTLNEHTKAMKDAGISTVITDNEMHVWVTDMNRVNLVNEKALETLKVDD
jgi:hypothetical protein